MIEVSWGEIAILSTIGLAMIGRQDLPRAARTAGQSVGRIVGLLQGARARADRFAAHNELKQLQNELRGGLRELDAVKSELAVSMTPGGMMGRNLGAMVPSVNNQAAGLSGAQPTPLLSATGATQPSLFNTVSSAQPMAPSGSGVQSVSSSRHLAPESQTIGAVAEEEWAAQGIAFRSRAEQGAGLKDGAVQQSTSGSAVLANLLQQTLIFDQYDRVVQEQDNILQSKVKIIQEKVQSGKAGGGRPKDAANKKKQE